MAFEQPACRIRANLAKGFTFLCDRAATPACGPFLAVHDGQLTGVLRPMPRIVP
jgi:hypothetical protein